MAEGKTKEKAIENETEAKKIEHKKVISSLDVARALNIRHGALLRKIRRIDIPNFPQYFFTLRPHKATLIGTTTDTILLTLYLPH